jgi:hypothetical protein
LFHVRADGGEGGGEVVEDLVENGVRVADGEGDEIHPYPICVEDLAQILGHGRSWPSSYKTEDSKHTSLAHTIARPKRISKVVVLVEVP